jgi:hypothetical protein
VKPLRLGGGSRAESHGVEKDAKPVIIFEDQNDTTQPSQSIELVDGELHVFDDPEGPNRTDLGTFPGGGGGGQVDEIIPGPGITVDNTDPERPIVSAKGGGDGVIYADFEATPGQLTPGAQSPRITVPFDFEIKSWRISAKAGQAGAATFDVLYSSSHSGAVASVVGSVAPSMVASNTADGSDMTGWTVSGAAGGVIVFQLDGVGGLTAARIELIVEKQ